MCALFITNCTAPNSSEYAEASVGTPKISAMASDRLLTIDDLIQDIVTHPAFEGFGDLLLPKDDNTAYYNIAINDVASLMPYHNAVHPEDVVDAVNHLIEENQHGNTIFYSFYSEAEKKTGSCQE